MKFKMNYTLTAILLTASLFIAACSDSGKTPNNPPSGVIVWADVSPIFQSNCVGCHGGSGGLYLTSYNNALTTGNDAPVIIPGDPTNSILVHALRGTATVAAQMPKGLTPLSESNISLIEEWITDGALEVEVTE